MVKSETVTFAVQGSKGFHKLELSRSLIRFVEFDFTYFWEQCIEAGRNARKTGRISKKLETMASSALIKCHPYVEACIATEFSQVVLDCIIAYICHSEGIGLEELWARCISPKSLYEKAIFNRVSEYKTGRGINQWINIVRMQEYARSKLKFVYETESNVMLRPADYRTRREYFDLAVAIAANETGCPMDKMPSVKKYTPSQLPDAVFMMGRMSKSIYRRLADVLGTAEMWERKTLNDHNRDQTALDAFSYVKDMPLPGQNDMNFALESMAQLPSTIYVPDSFKALIDLEFSLMAEENIYLSKCPRCGRFFARSIDERSPYCSRINSTGMTCADLINNELGIAALKEGEAVPAEIEKQLDNSDFIAELAAAAEEAKNSEQTSLVSRSDNESEKSVSPEPVKIREIPKELEKRCQKVYNMLYKRIGRLMTDSEFREWSKFLSDMKRDVRIGDAEIEEMEDFLSYWETAVKKQSSRSKRKGVAADIYEETEKDIPAPEETAAFDEAHENGELSRMFDEVLQASDEKGGSGISPAGTEALPEERAFKAFDPPKYNTVLEAMMDGKYKSEELLSDNLGSDEELSDITVNGKKVTLPKWERITRE